ncbi:unnamed protein product, partial [Allacma fusca]
MVVASSGTALAVTKTTQANPSSFNTQGDWDLNAVVANNDDIELGGAHDITADLALTIKQINLRGNDGRTITLGIAGDHIFGSIFGGGNETIGVTYSVANLALTLNGDAINDADKGIYRGLGNIDFGGQAGSALTVNNPNADTTLA